MTKVRNTPKSTNVCFKSDGDRGKRRSKEERGKVGTKKQPSGQRSVGTDSRRENSKVTVFRYKQQVKAKRVK